MGHQCSPPNFPLTPVKILDAVLHDCLVQGRGVGETGSDVLRDIWWKGQEKLCEETLYEPMNRSPEG